VATRSTSSPLDAHTSPTAGASTGKATAAFIVGIIGVIAAFLFPLLGLILGVVATVMGNGARKTTSAWQATAGFWLGIVSLVVSVAVMALTAAIMF